VAAGDKSSEPASLLAGQGAQAALEGAEGGDFDRAASIRRAVFAVVLAAGIELSWTPGAWVPLHGAIEILIIVCSAHIVSISFGIWYTQRDARWLVLSAGFALVTLYNLAHLLFYGGLVVEDPGQVTRLFIWAHENVVCVVLFAAACVIGAQALRRGQAALVIAALVAYSIALVAFGETAQRLVESSWHGRGNNLLNIFLCLAGLLIIGLRVAGGDRTRALVVLGTVIGLEMVAQLSYLAAVRVTDAYTTLGHLYKLAAFGVLYWGLFFAHFLRTYALVGKTGALFRTLVERSPAGIVLSRGGRIVHANPAFLQIFGFPDLDAARQVRLWDVDGDASVPAGQHQPASVGGTSEAALPQVRRAVRFNGEMIHVRVEHETVDMPDGRATLEYIVDLSETVNAQKELQRLANYDALTGLPNRTLLRDRLEQAVRVAQRAGDEVAVLFIDLDQFKEVNDTLGHAVGDELLKMVADRLKEVCRKEDTLGRLGGDEFLVIAQRLADQEGAATLAGKLIRALDTPFDLDGHEVYVGGSIGISQYPRDAQDAAGMIKNADVAMYQAKRGGGPRACFYSEEMNARAMERLEIGTELRRAMERDEFELFYQPKVDLESGRVTGAEALLRWRNPVRGLLPPAQFVPILEETGLISAVGRQVLAKACHQAMEWRAAGFGRIPVAVNLSASQFRGGQLAEEVELTLQASGLPHADLELEMTESVLLKDYEQARAPLEKLVAKGVRASLDDFGTGYSSLSSLHNLPVQCVKIDRSFTQGLRPGRNTIVAAIINVAHTLGMRVVAEGVETEGQREILRELGCNEMQGYLFAQPMSHEDFRDWLKAQRSRHLAVVTRADSGSDKNAD
jgi:diguanylate cyclase (GGDEF)-like protein/PAS domain S-box-containing protein